MLSKNVRNAISTIYTVNKLANSTGYAGSLLTVLTEFEFNNTASSGNWKSALESELLSFENLDSQIRALKISVAVIMPYYLLNESSKRPLMVN